MFIWYTLFIILGIVFVVSDKYDFWDNLGIGGMIWIVSIAVGLFLGVWVSDGQTEIVETNTYTLCDFSDYYVSYDEGTYLVIEDNGDLILRYEFEEEIKEKTFSSYEIEFTADEEKTYTITSYLEDVKSPILKHLFWNFNSYKNIIRVPENTPITYKR
jgi:hypothetical protein